jgi:hypothetical protein
MSDICLLILFSNFKQFRNSFICSFENKFWVLGKKISPYRKYVIICKIKNVTFVTLYPNKSFKFFELSLSFLEKNVVNIGCFFGHSNIPTHFDSHKKSIPTL